MALGFIINHDPFLGLIQPQSMAESLVSQSSSLNDSTGGVTFTRGTSAYDPYWNKIVAPGVRRRRGMPISKYQAIQADLIEGAATNLLAAGSSEHFELSSWNKAIGGTTVVTQAADVAPNGDPVDSLAIPNGATIAQNPGPAFSTNTFTGGIFLRVTSGTATLTLLMSSNGIRNVATKVITVTTTWQYFAVSGTGLSSDTGAAGIGLANSSGSTVTVSACLADLKESGVASSPISNRNLLLKSQLFNATWTNSNMTLTAAAANDPLSGTALAFNIADTSTSGFHFVRQTFTKAASSLAMTFSAYVKASAGTANVFLQLDDGGSNGFNIYVAQSGTLVQGPTSFGSGFSSLAYTITAVGSGWFRLTISCTTNTATSARCIIGTASGTTQNYAGGSSSIYAYGSQLEYGSSATAYWGTDATVGGRDADNLTCTYSTGTGSFTLLGLLIPYGWTGNANATNARLCDDSTTSGNSTLLINTSGVTAAAAKDTVSVKTGNGPSGTPSNGVLQQCAGVMGASNVTAYRNGVAGTPTSATPPWVGSSALIIGAKQGGAAEFANAWVAVLAFPRDLAASELLAIETALPVAA